MVKHTIGPWSVKGAKYSTTVRIEGANGIVICEVSDTSLEDEANSRLLAAAPELLAALQGIMSQDMETLQRLSPRVFHAARAAIAKATGESA